MQFSFYDSKPPLKTQTQIVYISTTSNESGLFQYSIQNDPHHDDIHMFLNV